jgi:hypothetical protein
MDVMSESFSLESGACTVKSYQAREFPHSKTQLVCRAHRLSLPSINSDVDAGGRLELGDW